MSTPGWNSVIVLRGEKMLERSKVRGSSIASGAHVRKVHRIFGWTPPRAQDFLGFRAVSAYSDGVIHRVYRRLWTGDQSCLRSVMQEITRHPLDMLDA